MDAKEGLAIIGVVLAIVLVTFIMGKSGLLFSFAVAILGIISIIAIIYVIMFARKLAKK